MVVHYGKRIEVKRKTLISCIGEVERYLYYIESGMVRMYTLNSRGEECTFDFVFANDFTNAFESYKFGKVSKIAIETLTDCVLYRFSKEEIAVAMMSGEMEVAAYLDVLENTFLRKLNREISLIKDTTYVQYCKLVHKHDALLDTVLKKHIASYLGVSAQTISRYQHKYHSASCPEELN